MATPNVRGAYELLRRAMQQQSLQQQGSDFCSTPNAALEVSSDSYGSPQGGLLGRLLALQAEQSRQQPFAGNNGPTSSEALDPNFRRLSRAPIAIRPQGAIGPSNRPDDRSSRAYSPFGGGPSLDLPYASGQGAGLVDAPMSPGPLPQIPMRAIPDWWKAAGQILQLDPTTWSGKGGGGNDNYRRCIRASDGSAEQWEEFCKYLERGKNNTVGGESQNRACWSKAYESENNRRGWCENQFGAN